MKPNATTSELVVKFVPNVNGSPVGKLADAGCGSRFGSVGRPAGIRACGSISAGRRSPGTVLFAGVTFCTAAGRKAPWPR